MDEEVRIFSQMWISYIYFSNVSPVTLSLYVLPTQCIGVFYVDLRTNSDYFSMQH
jgi:hypothetical protein